MKFFNRLTMITVVTLIILLPITTESFPTLYKRWTFNSWRLQSPRITSHAPFNPTTEYYSATIPTDIISHQDPLFHIVNDADPNESSRILFSLSQFLRALDNQQKKQGNGDGQV